MKRKVLNFTVRQLSQMIKKGTVTFDNPIQRPSGQWDIKKKSLLIHSLCTMFIPELYAIQYEGEIEGKNANIYDVIDGKQRLTTIMEYINNQFALIGVNPVTLTDTTYETYEISGKKFSDLDEDVKDTITSYMVSLRVIELEESDDEENLVDEIFYRLNNGSPVSKEHLTLISTNKTIQTFVRRIVNEHVLYNDVAHFTAGQLKKSDKEMSVLQTIVVLSGLGFKSFAAKDIEAFFKENLIKDDVLKKTEEAFDKIASAFGKGYNKFVQKIHIPMLASLYNEERFEQFALYYSEITFKDDEYRRFCGAGCTKKENVNRRLEAIKKFYKEYVEEN